MRGSYARRAHASNAIGEQRLYLHAMAAYIAERYRNEPSECPRTEAAKRRRVFQCSQSHKRQDGAAGEASMSGSGPQYHFAAVRLSFRSRRQTGLTAASHGGAQDPKRK